ncbi:hypothetical protein EVAR_86540_1 [Eumeta japonica]|uniref:Uncharacterized protein n=1 Tax=Eumeta variegata TaxID=151549 RepID=A0A4C1VNY7_EUMVA|nr:hypothetical protein EVAR_86540_1 [Eumeta japonica]
MRFIIETDKRVTYQQIRTSSDMVWIKCTKSFMSIECAGSLILDVIPHNLTEAQELRRVNKCRKMMQRFANGPEGLARAEVDAARGVRGCAL